jgi:hypothetical protein
MEDINVGNPADRVASRLNQENSKGFTLHLPYKTTFYLLSNIPMRRFDLQESIGRQKIVEKIYDKLCNAEYNSSKFLGFHKKTPIDLSYEEINVLGKSELSYWIRCETAVIARRDPDFDEIMGKFNNILGKLEDENNYHELGRLMRRFVFPKRLEPGLLEFSGNFLVLNSAFVKAGGIGNQGLTELFSEIKNNKTSPRSFPSANKIDLQDEITMHRNMNLR